MKLQLVASAVALCLTGPLAAQQTSPEQEAKREQEALKRAKILRIVGMPGVTASLGVTLQDLGAKVAGQEARIELPADALFEPGKADLKPEAAARLQKVALVLREFPAAPLVQPYLIVPALIEGHADDGGSDADSQALSERRAAAVKGWLVEEAGIDPARLATRGWGRSKPIAAPDGKDSASGRKSGRVEIVVRKN